MALQEKSNSIPTWAIAAGAIVIVVLFLGMWVAGIYNGEVQRDQAAQGQWSNVEVQYQRRFDLIPNLINTVQGAVGAEQETLVKLTQLRSQWQTQTNINDKVNTANEFESTLSKLLIITENYPVLQSQQTFQDLMVQLEGTENRISTERVRYNEVVREYNTYIRVFPNSIFIGGNESKEYFDSVSGSETSPEVPTDFTP